MSLNGENKPRTLKEVADSLIREFGWEDDFYKLNIEEVWKDTVGEKIASVAIIKKFEKGLLFIETDNSVWKAELFIRRGSIRDKLNKQLKKDIIREIIIK